MLSQGEHLRLDVTRGLLNLPPPAPTRRERLENDLSIPAPLQQLAAEDTGSGRSLNHCHSFIGRGSLWGRGGGGGSLARRVIR